MSYWTIKQKILFVDINLHLIKIVYHFMQSGIIITATVAASTTRLKIIFVNKYLRIAVLCHTGQANKKFCLLI